MSSPRPAPCRARPGAALLALAAAAGGVAGGCKGRRAPIATLAEASAPVERAVGAGPWAAAPLGTGYFVGDAARTGDGTARLAVAGGARIAMAPHTILRFGGAGGGAAAGDRLDVEVGEIELAGGGAFQLEMGELQLGARGGVRIGAGRGGHDTLELLVGDARLRTAGGDGVALRPGEVLQLGVDLRLAPIPVDAGAAPADAGAEAGVDGGVPTGGDGQITVEITGLGAELQPPGGAWAKLAAGATTLPPGARLRLGRATSSVLRTGAGTLELSAGARVLAGDDGTLALEQGAATLATAPGTEARLRLPGGLVAVQGAQGPAAARAEVGGRDTRISVARGAALLTGGAGAELAMARGDSAALDRGGAIRVLQASPTYFDLRVAAGDTVTLHDPRPPTAVQLAFAGRCPAGGVVEVDRDARFRTPRVSAGAEAANVSLAAGTWAYRVRCTQDGAEGAAVASGRIAVTRDDGRRALPRGGATNAIDADGRNWRISYQSAIPSVAIKYLGAAGGSLRLHLAQGGKDVTFEAQASGVTVPGSRLREGSYTYWFDRDGVKQGKVSTLVIDFDQTAPQVYIEAPVDGAAFGPAVDVRGAVLAGWTASVDGVELPLDRQRRFAASAPPPAGRALAIRLAHPERGVHYYLRRGK